jgi:MFS family permease
VENGFSDERSKAYRKCASELRANAGNALEFYDLLIFGYFAIVIGKQFFPTGDEWSSLMLSVGTFGISYIMRPLGSVFLGAYADRAGRKAALTLSISLMMIGSTMIAFAPPYAVIGLWAPAILIVARLMQGFSSGGEFGAATAFMVEHATSGQRQFNASWQATSQGLATVLAAGVSALVTYVLTQQQVFPAISRIWRRHQGNQVALSTGDGAKPSGSWHSPLVLKGSQNKPAGPAVSPQVAGIASLCVAGWTIAERSLILYTCLLSQKTNP